LFLMALRYWCGCLQSMMALPLMERIQSPASSWPYAMSPLVTSLTKVNVSKGGPGYNTSNTHFTSSNITLEKGK
jgi:hypothetical protein